MSKFTDHISKELFLYSVKRRGWVMPGEAEVWEKLYDYATTVQNPELDTLLRTVAIKHMKTSADRTTRLTADKESAKKLALPEELSKEIMALPDQVNEEDFSKTYKEWFDQNANSGYDKIKADSGESFEKRFGKLSEEDVKQKIYEKGWGSDADDSVIHNLYVLSNLYMNPVICSMFEEMINTDVSDPEKRKSVVAHLKEQAKEVIFITGESKSFQTSINNFKETLTDKDKQKRDKKLDDLIKNRERNRIGSERDAVFIDTARKMGWKEEDIPLLNIIMEKQKKYRNSSSGEPLEDLRGKIMETKLDPAKYYTMRNKLLTEAVDSKSDKRMDSLRHEYEKGFGPINDALDKTRDFVPVENQEEHRNNFVSAMSQKWKDPAEASFLSRMFDARVNKDGKVNRILNRTLDFVREGRYARHNLINQFLTDIRSIPADNRTPAQKEALAVINLESDLYFVLDKSQFYPDNGRNRPLPDRVKNPRMALFYAATKYLTQTLPLQYDDRLEEIKKLGFAPRIFALSIAEKMKKIAEDAKDPAGMINDEYIQVYGVVSNMESALDQYRDITLTDEEKEMKAKTDAYLDSVIAENMKIYTALDPNYGEDVKRDRAEFIEAGKRAGWTEPGDEQLLEHLYNSRYDRDGNVDPEIDGLVRNIALPQGNIGAVRLQWLNNFCQTLSGNHRDLSSVQNRSYSAAFEAANAAEKMVPRENAVNFWLEKGWAADRNVLRRIYDTCLAANIVNTSRALSYLRRGRSGSYNMAPVAQGGPLIHLQTLEVLGILKEELTKQYNEGNHSLKKREIIKTGIEFIDEEIKKADPRVIEREKAENERLTGLYRAEMEEGIEAYARRMVRVREEDFDRFAGGIEVFNTDTNTLKDLKETALLVAKEKESFKAALKNPESPEAKPFMEKLYALEKELERYERDIPEKEYWPYDIMLFTKELIPDFWEKYREQGTRIERLNESAEPYRQKMLSLSENDLIEISRLCVDPDEGADFPAELNNVLIKGRTLSQDKNGLAEAKQQYNSVGANRFKSRYVALDDALGRFINSIHPSRVNRRARDLMEKYFPHRFEQFNERKNRISEYTNGKAAFLDAAEGAGWNADGDRDFLGRLYDGALDVNGSIPAVENGKDYLTALRELAAAKEPNAMKRYDSFVALRGILNNVKETAKNDSIRTAISVLNQKMDALGPEIDRLRQEENERYEENLKRERWAGNRMGLPNRANHLDMIRRRRREDEDRRNKESRREYRNEINTIDREHMNADLPMHGWNERESSFIKRLCAAALDENGEEIKIEGMNRSLHGLGLHLAATERDDLDHVSAGLMDIDSFFNALPEGQYTDELRLLRQEFGTLKAEIADRYEAEKALHDVVESQMWVMGQPKTAEGWVCPQELYDEILSLAEKYPDNEVLKKLAGDFKSGAALKDIVEYDQILRVTYDLVKEARLVFTAIGDEHREEKEKVLGDIDAYLNLPERRQAYDNAVYSNDDRFFSDLDEKEIWKSAENQRLLRMISEAQYDHNGDKHAGISEVAVRAEAVDSEEALTALISDMAEEIRKIPEYDRSVSQQGICAAAERRAYVAPPVNEESEEVNRIRRENAQKAEERRIQKEKDDRYSSFEDRLWVKEGDKEFIEKIFDAKPAQDSEAYDRIVGELSQTNRSQYWKASECLGKLVTELEKIPEADRNDAQKDVIRIAGQMIEQFNALEPGWLEYKAAGFPELEPDPVPNPVPNPVPVPGPGPGENAGPGVNNPNNENIIVNENENVNENAAGDNNVHENVNENLNENANNNANVNENAAGNANDVNRLMMDAEREKFSTIKDNLDKVEKAYKGHSNSAEYNTMIEKLGLMIQEPDPARYAQLRGELGLAAKLYLDHTGVGKALHSNSEIRRKCAFLIMGLTGNENYADYASRANRKRGAEDKISVNTLDTMPGVGAPAERNRTNLANLQNEQQAADGGPARNQRQRRNAGGGNGGAVRENNADAPANNAPGRRNGN